MTKSFLKIAAVVTAMCSGSAVFGQSCGYPDCWGAIGIGPNGAYGYSHGHPTEDTAIEAAQQGCGWTCTNVQSFANGCGSMAVGATGGWGWGVAETSIGAEEIAYAYCSDNDYDCGIVVTNCSY